MVLCRQVAATLPPTVVKVAVRPTAAVGVVWGWRVVGGVEVGAAGPPFAVLAGPGVPPTEVDADGEPAVGEVVAGDEPWKPGTADPTESEAAGSRFVMSLDDSIVAWPPPTSSTMTWTAVHPMDPRKAATTTQPTMVTTGRSFTLTLCPLRRRAGINAG